MFTKADILTRLQNGESTDTIANEMANLLNEAEAEKRAMDAQIIAQERENARIMDAKRAAVNDMLDAVCDYLVAAGEDDLIEELRDFDTDKVIELLDGSIKMAKSLEQLKELQFPFTELHKAATINPKVHKIVVDADADDADKVIGDFLKNLGL
jgi:hypothetical protein